MAFGGNTRDLGSFGEETDKITDLHQIFRRCMQTVAGDSIAGIKRRRRDVSSDGVRNFTTVSGRGRLKEDLESSTWRRRTDDEDAHEHVRRVLEIVDLFHFPGVTHDAVMLRVFLITLKGLALRWKKGLPVGVINTWDLLEKEFISQYCSPFKTAKKLKEIRYFKQEMRETLYQAWERYNDLLFKCPQQDLNNHQKVQIFYTGLDISTRRMLDSTGFIPLMTTTQALKSIQVMADHSHNCFKGAHLTKECPLGKEDKTIEQSKYMRYLEETIIKFYEESIKKQIAYDEWIRKSIKNTDLNIRALKNTTKNLQEKSYQLTQTALTNTGEKFKARTTMGKENIKESVPRDLPPTPFLGHLKEQIGSPYRTCETICMIENPGEVHKMKDHEDEGDMDVVWDIIVKDVERLMQFLTPTVHTLPNRRPVVQPYMPLGPVYDKKKIIREEEQDYDIPLHDGVMQLVPLSCQTVYITPPDDDYVTPATNPILDKQLNEFRKEFFILLGFPKRKIVTQLTIRGGEVECFKVTVEVLVFVEGVFGRDLENDLERVMVVVDWSFFVEDHPKRSSKGVVQVDCLAEIVRARVVSRVVFMGWFWMGEDSFDERSMKSVLGIFLRGFLVEELALEAMKMMIKERFWS
ncbi:ribonuclease H-like domain-containing protein [Tanacetum coccineum]